ncbi:hypothetical protein HPP92_025954 [Vanilla planifolia]|uniref:Uncharacterized protein n=1 Tax=Vanilla planifolia TaxID=51239 RepID=A0A835U845_VANPL|nr:hypothetical protein HPP92_025954 [Vanilla planifolia]
MRVKRRSRGCREKGIGGGERRCGRGWGRRRRRARKRRNEEERGKRWRRLKGCRRRGEEKDGEE